MNLTLDDIFKRRKEIRESMKKFPSLTPDQAYRKWKEERGEKPLLISPLEELLVVRKETSKNSLLCTKCGSKVIVEKVCGSCVEHKVGYRSKMKCLQCKHTELSRKDVVEWLMELYSY